MTPRPRFTVVKSGLAPWVLALASPLSAQMNLFQLDVTGIQDMGRMFEVVGDTDGDGVPDVVVSRRVQAGSGYADVLRLHSGRTSAEIGFSGLIGSSMTDLCGLGDANGDGALDLAASTNDGTILDVRSCRPRSVVIEGYPDRLNLPPGYGWRIVGTTDFVRDGARDLVATRCTPAGTGHFNGGAVCFSVRGNRVLWTYSGPQGAAVTVVNDRNGDRVPEVVLAGTSGGSSSCVVLSGATGSVLATFPSPSTAALGTLPDTDGDGYDELLADHRIVAQSPARAGQVLATAPVNPVTGGVAIGDVNLDGVRDWAIGGMLIPWNQWAISVCSGRDATELRRLDFDLGRAMRPRLIQADFARDGVPDLAFATYTAGPYESSRVQVITWAGASYSTFGVGCRGTIGILQLAAQGLPTVGTDLRISVANLAPLWGAVLLLGASNTEWAGLPLPVTLDPLGMPGCTAYISGDSGIGFVPFAANHVVPLPIPNVPGALGTRFCNQVVQMDLRANPLGLVASNAGVGLVGTN